MYVDRGQLRAQGRVLTCGFRTGLECPEDETVRSKFVIRFMDLVEIDSQVYSYLIEKTQAPHNPQETSSYRDIVKR